MRVVVVVVALGNVDAERVINRCNNVYVRKGKWRGEDFGSVTWRGGEREV